MILVTSAQMRLIEAETCREQDIPSFALMERAGEGVFQVAFELLASHGAIRAVVVCGRGNNGGDGFVAAELLARSGIDVSVFLTAPLAEVEGDAEIALRSIIGSAAEPKPLIEEADFEALRVALEKADLVIDAILGTGVSGKARGSAARAIELINETAECSILSVDIPSGMNGDTGHIPGPTVDADVTMTIGLPKVGLFQYPGARYTGELNLVDIGIDGAAALRHTDTVIATPDIVVTAIPEREPDMHKGDAGRVGVIAGSRGMTGAAALASTAAMRGGCGLVHLWVAESLVPALEAKLNEVIIKSLPEESPGHPDAPEDDDVRTAVGGLILQIADYDSLLIGPGLSTQEGSKRLVRRVLRESDGVPLVLDADALNILAAEPTLIEGHEATLVMTPHPGELARLMGTTAEDIQADRLGYARRAAERFNAVVILKGARTVVVRPDGFSAIIPAGNNGMATAGSGDVLAGLVAALLAQGAEAFDAGVVAAYVHALSGDLAASEIGEHSLIASDLLTHLPRAFLRARFPHAGDEFDEDDDDDEEVLRESGQTSGEEEEFDD